MTNSKQSITKSLKDEAFSKKALIFAWNELNKSNPSSHGVDDETIGSFKEKYESKINQLSKKLKNNSFNFSQVRGVLIRKDNGKQRPLRIANIEDRIVIKSIAIIVEEQISKEFIGLGSISFAYQRGKGVKDALTTIVKHHRLGYNHVVKCDIVDFFGTVDRMTLFKKQLFPLLRDDTLNSFIESALSQPVSTDGIDKKLLYYFLDSESGIPQGNALSPLLSNLYLNDLDRKYKESDTKLIRYADDFLLMSKTEDRVIAEFGECQNLLSGINLTLHPLNHPNSKSQLILIGKDSFNFLSVGYDGDKLYPSSKAIKKFKDKIAEASRKAPNLLIGLLKMNNTVQGWIASYEFTDLPKYYKELDDWLGYCVHTLLTKLEIRIKSNSTFKVSIEGKKGRMKDVNSIKKRALNKLGILDVVEIHKSKKK